MAPLHRVWREQSVKERRAVEERERDALVVSGPTNHQFATPVTTMKTRAQALRSPVRQKRVQETVRERP